MQAVIEVENLKCGGCANTIRTSLEKLAGVDAVSVDVATSKVEVSGAIDREEILHKLGGLGYPEKGTGTGFQKVKSYVSCAVGKMS